MFLYYRRYNKQSKPIDTNTFNEKKKHNTKKHDDAKPGKQQINIGRTIWNMESVYLKKKNTSKKLLFIILKISKYNFPQYIGCKNIILLVRGNVDLS